MKGTFLQRFGQDRIFGGSANQGAPYARATNAGVVTTLRPRRMRGRVAAGVPKETGCGEQVTLKRAIYPGTQLTQPHDITLVQLLSQSAFHWPLPNWRTEGTITCCCGPYRLAPGMDSRWKKVQSASGRQRESPGEAVLV